MHVQNLWTLRILLNIFAFFALFKTCSGNYLPTRVLGLFRNEQSSPSQAAKLAVENASRLTSPNLNFTYQHLDYGDVALFFEEDLQKELQDSLIVTGNPDTCELVSRKMKNIPNTFLICYGPPKPNTLQHLDSISNLYLSEHNPLAMIPCVHKMVQLIQRKASSSCPSMSMIVDRSHSYHQIENSLVAHMAQRNIPRVSFYMLEKCHAVKVPTTDNLHVMFAVLSDFHARALLCKLYQKNSYGYNIKLLFLGLSGDDLLNLINADDDSFNSNADEGILHDDGYNRSPIGNYSCTKEQLLEVAQGQFLLEFPDWDTSDKSVEHELLYRRLHRKPWDFWEAPLAYDSVWAITQAIRRTTESQATSVEESQEEYSDFVRAELKKSFSGESGEFSFNDKKLRSWTQATIIIKRFENGTLTEIGRHSNANSSFFGLKDEFLFSGTEIWSTASNNGSSPVKSSECFQQDLHPCDAALVCNSLLVKVFLFGVLPLSLFLMTLLCLRKRICRRCAIESGIGNSSVNHQPLKNRI